MNTKDTTQTETPQEQAQEAAPKFKKIDKPVILTDHLCRCCGNGLICKTEDNAYICPFCYSRDSDIKKLCYCGWKIVEDTHRVEHRCVCSHVHQSPPTGWSIYKHYVGYAVWRGYIPNGSPDKSRTSAKNLDGDGAKAAPTASARRKKKTGAKSAK